MGIKKTYSGWAAQYDTTVNKTRDLEALALRMVIGGISAETILEIGCGTGKNTQYLAERAGRVLAVDLSPEMLAQAGKKIKAGNVIPIPFFGFIFSYD